MATEYFNSKYYEKLCYNGGRLGAETQACTISAAVVGLISIWAFSSANNNKNQKLLKKDVFVNSAIRGNGLKLQTDKLVHTLNVLILENL